MSTTVSTSTSPMVEVVAQAATHKMSEQAYMDSIGAGVIDRIVNNLVREPEMEKLAVRLLLDRIYACTSPRFSTAFERIDKDILIPGLLQYVRQNADLLDDTISPYQDMRYTYAGLKTLMESYLQRDARHRLIERPQYMHMRVAAALFFPDTERVIQAYNLFSRHRYTHATPTLFNAGLVSGGYASCFLLEPQDDLEDIFDIISECASISKLSGGVGLNLSLIRARGSLIHRTNGRSDGIIPLIQVINSVSKYVNQGGRRNGAVAIYIEPWHADIMDFLNLRRNHGSDALKARDIYTGLWVPDLFMIRVQNDEPWPLFCPSVAPNLAKLYDDEFERAFLRFEKARMYVRVVPARDIWKAIIESQIETGTPYILFKDTCNRNNNLMHVGPVRCSNLCAEIILPVGHDTTSVCNLASVNLMSFVSTRFTAATLDQIKRQGFDFKELSRTVKFMVDALNETIDRTMYPSDAAEKTNLKYRPIGIGIQGLAGVFVSFGLSWQSPLARQLNEAIAAEIYMSAYERSVDLAKINGPYPEFIGSRLAVHGIMHHDLYQGSDKALDPERISKLRRRIAKYGVFNSTLTALMPTASTSLLMGNTESFEPVTSNLFQRNTQSGFFTFFNPFVVQRARELGIFDEDLIHTLIRDNGSVANTELSESDKLLFATVWEIPQRTLVDMAADRAPFVDMSQSLNLYFSEPTYQRVTSALFYGWERGLKTGCYYLRTKPAITAAKETVIGTTAATANVTKPVSAVAETQTSTTTQADEQERDEKRSEPVEQDGSDTFDQEARRDDPDVVTSNTSQTSLTLDDTTTRLSTSDEESWDDSSYVCSAAAGGVVCDACSA